MLVQPTSPNPPPTPALPSPMPTPLPTPLRRRAAAILFAVAALPAQETPPTDNRATQAQIQPAPTIPKAHFVLRRYPEDKDAAIAVVGGRTLTLGELVDHIDARHYPGFRDGLSERPEFKRYLQSDLIAPWVRQFADLEAVRQASADREIDAKQLEEAQSAALKKSFEGWLATYVEDQRQHGHPGNLSQRRVNALLADFQLQNGLAAELQGLLDHLVPDDFNRAELQLFFRDHARYFGGQVTIAHILVQHRDAGTGILLDAEGIARANARLAEIRGRLRPDGSNFEEIARLFSDDTRTGKDGGLLTGVRRFDDRLPATLCRAAWALQDGEVGSEVVETQYGWHLIKRIDFNQQMFILFTDDAIPSIRIVMRRALQENLLLGARERASLRLLM